MKSRTWQRVVAAMALGVAVIANAADEPKIGPSDAPPDGAAPVTKTPVVVTAPAAANTDSVKVLQLPKLSLPPLLDQVVKLSQSGADETVIRAYVEKAAPPYRITGNEIVQLRDLGISQGVIMSLIEHSQSAAAANVTEVVAPQSLPQPQAQTNAAVVTPPDAAPEFYDSLSPYGSWLDVPGYGWCWQPTVVVVDSGWRPYSDGGYWLSSDYGWYWHSYYSWGWAPFHYGRWFCHDNRGWLWCPDRTWGPAWVCWRNSATHCGWAPLPPGACFTAGHGWTHHGVGVGIDFGFGIPAAHFTFVAHDRFSDRHVGGHAARGRDAVAAFNSTRVVNNHAFGANNRIINHGIARETIASASKTPIRDVAVRELPRGNNVTMPDRVNRVGNSDVVFRPGSQISVPRNTGIVSSQSGRMTTAARNTVAINPSMAPRSQSHLATAGNVTASRAMPNYSQNYVSRGALAQPNGGAAAGAIMRANPSPQFQARGYARPSAPAASMPRSFSPSYNAPSYSAPSAGRSFSGGGGMSFGGGGGSRGASSVARSSGGRR